MKTDKLSALRVLVAILRTTQNDVTCKDCDRLEVCIEFIK